MTIKIQSPYRLKVVPTHKISLYIAGDIDTIRRSCRRFCMMIHETCVTIKECEYVYTGGAETGVEIGLVNYPRFPSTRDELWTVARDLAIRLIEDCDQYSALLTDDTETFWITRRKEPPI